MFILSHRPIAVIWFFADIMMRKQILESAFTSCVTDDPPLGFWKSINFHIYPCHIYFMMSLLRTSAYTPGYLAFAHPKPQEVTPHTSFLPPLLYTSGPPESPYIIRNLQVVCNIPDEQLPDNCLCHLHLHTYFGLSNPFCTFSYNNSMSGV